MTDDRGEPTDSYTGLSQEAGQLDLDNQKSI